MDLRQHIDAILILEASRLDGKFSSSAFSLARQISSLGFKLIHINNPPSILDLLNRNKVKEYHRFQDSFADNPEFKSLFTAPVLPINWLPKGYLYLLMQKFNNFLFNLWLKKLLRKENIRHFVFNNSFLPFYHPLPKVLGEKELLNIYLSVDNMEASEYLGKHGTRLEFQAIKDADLVIVTSSALADKFRTAGNVTLLPNACNFEIFRQELDKEHKVPKELEGINKPVIGYFGNIDDQRLDFDLIEKMILSKPEYSFVFIGPLNSNEFHKRRLLDKKNLHLIEAKAYNALPRYLKYFDCCIIPFLKNEMNKYIYPLKINEYLCAGKPVVTSDFSIDIRSFDGLVIRSQDHKSFIDALETAISNNSEELERLRIKKASENSWENRAKDYIQLIEKNIKTP